MLALLMAALAFAASAVFDRAPAKNWLQFFAGKILPLSLVFSAIFLGAAGLIQLVDSLVSTQR
jgi:hypothetical protein